MSVELRAAIKYVIDTVLERGLIKRLDQTPPIPKDPRERALYLRKRRNTGPGRQGPLDGRRRR